MSLWLQGKWQTGAWLGLKQMKLLLLFSDHGSLSCQVLTPLGSRDLKLFCV